MRVIQSTIGIDQLKQQQKIVYTLSHLIQAEFEDQRKCSALFLVCIARPYIDLPTQLTKTNVVISLDYPNSFEWIFRCSEHQLSQTLRQLQC